MNLSEYETTLVLRPDISGDTVESTLDKVRDAVRGGGGKLLAINHWGKKKLAYDIDKHSRGIYVHTQYLGAGGLVAELERNLRISDQVLRFLTVTLGNDVNPDEREEQAYVAPQYEETPEPEEAQGEGEAEELQASAVESSEEASEAKAEAKPEAEAEPQTDTNAEESEE